jgi:hypothetical protein
MILFRLTLLLKIKGILIVLRKTEFYIIQMLENHIFLQLFKLIVQMIIYAHSLACTWYLVA